MRKTLKKTNNNKSIKESWKWREDAMNRSRNTRRMLKMNLITDLKARGLSNNKEFNQMLMTYLPRSLRRQFMIRPETR